MSDRSKGGDEPGCGDVHGINVSAPLGPPSAGGQQASQTLISSLSRRIFASSSEQLDVAVMDAFRAIGGFFGADCVSLIELVHEGDWACERYTWVDETSGPLPERPPRLPLSSYRWLVDELRHRAVFVVPRMRDLPDDVLERTPLRELGTKAAAWIPVHVDGHLIGLIALLWRKRERTADPDQLAAFSVVGDVLLGAIARQRSEAERVRLVAELDAERRRLNEIVSTVPGIIWENRGPAMMFVNNYAETLLGYTAEELARPGVFRSIVHPDDLPTMDRSVQTKLMRGEDETLPFRWRTKDGRWLWAQGRAIPIRDHEGRVVGVRGVTLDITEQKQMEAQLRHSQQMEALGRLAGGVAHDFNNLLGVILMQAESGLGETPPEGRLHHRLQEIQEAAEGASQLTRQLLALSRKHVLSLKVLDVNDSVTQLLQVLQSLVREDIELELQLQEGPLAVRADPAQLDQVLVNLAANAREAMPNGGRLTIHTSRVTIGAAQAHLDRELKAGPYVTLTVSDTGIGMDSDTMAQVFEPFFTTKVRGSGTGLGLATVYGIVKQHEGHIRVYSAPGKGAAFRIFLPQVVGPCADDSPAEPPADFARTLTGRAIILLVEDQDAVRRLAAEALRGQGHTVLEAVHGADALDKAASHEGCIDLLLTDVIMPGMNGRDLYGRLAELRPQMRVLFMSGYADEVLGHHGMLEDGVNFIPKPFSLKALLEKVRATLLLSPVPAARG